MISCLASFPTIRGKILYFRISFSVRFAESHLAQFLINSFLVYQEESWENNLEISKCTIAFKRGSKTSYLRPTCSFQTMLKFVVQVMASVNLIYFMAMDSYTYWNTKFQKLIFRIKLPNEPNICKRDTRFFKNFILRIE